MPEQLKPVTLQQSHAKTLREDAVRRLSRSPHPYHRQQFELSYSSERFNNAITNTLPTRSSLRSTQTTDDEASQDSRRRPESYRESTNSDSGTEADDEHFLKGLPAPKLRPHKGLRGADSSPSGTPSPLLSPTFLEDDSLKTHSFLRQRTAPSAATVEEDEAAKAAEKFRRKRRIEVVRRSAEAAIICFVGGILCLDSQVRRVIYIWRKGQLQYPGLLKAY